MLELIKTFGAVGMKKVHFACDRDMDFEKARGRMSCTEFFPPTFICSSPNPIELYLEVGS